MKVRRIDFYPDEWLAGTLGLSAFDRGIYITICALIYSRGGPINRELVKRHSGEHGLALNASLGRLIKAGKVSEKDGEIVQERCENELRNVRERFEKASENGTKGNEIKKVRAATRFGAANATTTTTTTTTEDIAPDGAITPTVVSPRRGTRLPADWRPDPQDRQYALDKGLDPDEVAEGFTDYWRAKAGRDANKLDWHATWRTWCRRQPLNPQGGNGHARRRSPAEKLYAGGFAAFQEYERRQGGGDVGGADALPLLGGRRQ